MSFLGLTDAGYDAPRTSDFLTIIRDDYEARTGLIIDWDRDLFLGSITASMAAALNRLSEGVQAIYDSQNPHAGKGIHADDAAFFVGINRVTATASQVSLTVTGVPGTIILKGKIVEGGGASGTQRWSLLGDVTLDGSGSGLVTAAATSTGAILASVNQVNKIVTPVAGWDTVTNNSAASVGKDRESDAALLARRDIDLASTGKRTARALRGELNSLSYTTSATVIENVLDTASIIEGVTLDPHSVLVVVGGALSTIQGQAIGEIIWNHLPVSVGVTTIPGNNIPVTVTKADGFQKTVSFAQPISVSVNVVAVLTLNTGVVIGDVQALVQAAITNYFISLSPGDDVRMLGLQVVIGSITGISGLSTFTLNGGTSDIVTTLIEKGVEGTVTVS